MPEGDQGVGSREREQQNLGKASPSQNPTPRQDFAAPLEQYPPSAASMMASAQRTPPVRENNQIKKKQRQHPEQNSPLMCEPWHRFESDF